MFSNFFNSFYTPKPEDFQKEGYLTPQQFVEAGDQLTLFGWKWESSLPQLQHKQLPSEKQFLSIAGRSSVRIKNVLKQGFQQEIVDGFLTTVDDTPKQQEEESKEDEDFVPCRSYQLSITYDSKYHVPRMWLSGNDQEGQPMNKDQIFQDIMAEYQNETVSEETHPHLGFRQITIHPCQHSQVLKSFIEKAKERGVTLKPNQALIIFLQFMSGVMPTIEYDSTIDLDFEM